MPDFYQKITDMHSNVEELVRKIPGFKGYFARQDRRAADRLLRESLVRGFGEQLDEFTRLQRQLVDAGGLRYMEQVKAVDTRLRTFVDKIESAAEGYAGFFGPVKIDEAALANVYAFDNTLFAYREQLASGLKDLDKAIGSEGIEGVLDGLEALVSELARTFDRRIDVLRGLQDSV